MKHALTRIAPALIVGVLIVGAGCTWAAKAPLSPETLKKQSSHIISGEVLEVTSKVQKSRIERAKGIHRDRVFTIKVQVEAVSKGGGVKAGDRVEVFAWKPSVRMPRVVGLQGHTSIPEKGNRVTFYLKAKDGRFAPLLPNGITIQRE